MVGPPRRIAPVTRNRVDRVVRPGTFCSVATGGVDRLGENKNRTAARMGGHYVFRGVSGQERQNLGEERLEFLPGNYRRGHAVRFHYRPDGAASAGWLF